MLGTFGCNCAGANCNPNEQKLHDGAPNLMQWLIKHKALLLASLASSLTSILWVLALPPFDYAEAAYIAFVPILLWLYRQPSWRATLGFSFLCGCSSWCATLIWLRHVTAHFIQSLYCPDAVSTHCPAARQTRLVQPRTVHSDYLPSWLYLSFF